MLVAESQKNRVLVYDVRAPGLLGPRRVFAELPAKDESTGQVDNQPDGMCLDAAGNLYIAHYGMRQVQVLDPQGKLIARLPGGNLTTSNVAFGGPNLDQLYVTGGLGLEAGGGGLFRLDLGIKGLPIVPDPPPSAYIRVVIRLCYYQLHSPNADSVIELPVSGHLCLQVHNGHKVFDLRQKVTTKVFSPEINLRIVIRQINRARRVGVHPFAPTVRRWNVEERWYEEDYVNGSPLIRSD